METLNGKIALVTGGSRGLGRAIAIALAAAGADVSVNYCERSSAANDAATEIRKLGRRAIAVRADVSDEHQVESLLSTTERELGNVNILVNNAGVTRPQAIEEITIRDFDELIRTNLRSVFLVTQRALPAMRAGRYGRIINLSSVAAQVGGVIGPHYAASKAGIIGLTHSYANLLAREGITVNALAPALVVTDMVTSNPKAKPELIPIGRFGQPDEVATVAVMLAGNGYITGQTINVNGGWYMSS